MKLEGAIFDFDGTLLDSMGVWDTLGSDFLRLRGIAA
ncbi:MAG TPA: HAD family phosphatase, partial [Ruminococcaceae bacterium]|nr:HAD family phosphatase [Oscillospiraceae bacterium]